MKTALTIVLLLLLSNTGRAATIDLTCSGVMHSYVPKHIEGAVAPQATVVDLENQFITTPVGEFEIGTVSDDSISFKAESPPSYPGLSVFGTLDRLTGLMRIFWRKPNDNTRAQMFAELNCSKARRLF
ncbi:hypothetical protein IVB46_04120 [Bradyrhizobium sp. 61]|uniref:hypothetical protein n=1 Tax=unclassified Bradyrhizobium TaxID=2631580 RepID=UPI001FF83330|nr:MULTISPECIES: hypothetical protein [unclassified Bradyrhizobium]MCK1274428.1 hypothetical protein [Bradyrhizobium sp. 61]MCK1459826.1 hypothetical protein [Bradyrhizobium sp. 2]